MVGEHVPHIFLSSGTFLTSSITDLILTKKKSSHFMTYNAETTRTYTNELIRRTNKNIENIFKTNIERNRVEFTPAKQMAMVLLTTRS